MSSTESVIPECDVSAQCLFPIFNIGTTEIKKTFT